MPLRGLQAQTKLSRGMLSQTGLGAGPKEETEEMSQEKKKRTLELCLPCATKLGRAFVVSKISGGADNKITCVECGRRRYGATYTVSKREGGGGA